MALDRGFDKGSIRLPKRSFELQRLRSVPLISISYDRAKCFHSDNSCSIVGEHVENSGKLWRVAALATKAALWVR